MELGETDATAVMFSIAPTPMRFSGELNHQRSGTAMTWPADRIDIGRHGRHRWMPDERERYPATFRKAKMIEAVTGGLGRRRG